MRDIRPDLQERLENIETERIQLKKQLLSLDRREERIRDLLVDETTRLSDERPFSQESEEEDSASPVKKFILDTLADRRPWNLDDLKSLAEEIDLFSGNPSVSPGRSLNFALVGLQRQGYVDRLATGQAAGAWILALPDTSQSEASSDKTDDAPPATTDEASNSEGLAGSPGGALQP